MIKILNILILLVTFSAYGQSGTPEDFEFKHIVFNYKTDKVDILVKSKKGEENIPKPLFLSGKPAYTFNQISRKRFL